MAIYWPFIEYRETKTLPATSHARQYFSNMVCSTRHLHGSPIMKKKLQLSWLAMLVMMFGWQIVGELGQVDPISRSIQMRMVQIRHFGTSTGKIWARKIFQWSLDTLQGLQNTRKSGLLHTKRAQLKFFQLWQQDLTFLRKESHFLSLLLQWQNYLTQNLS